LNYSDALKGIELPINVIIVISIAVIVLLSVISLYFSGWLSGTGTINIEVVKNDACRRLLMNCFNDVNLITIDNFDADSDGKIDSGIGTGDCDNKTMTATARDNLYMLCKCHYNANEDECRDICMCKTIASVSSSGPPLPP